MSQGLHWATLSQDMGAQATASRDLADLYEALGELNVSLNYLKAYHRIVRGCDPPMIALEYDACRRLLGVYVEIGKAAADRSLASLPAEELEALSEAELDARELPQVAG